MKNVLSIILLAILGIYGTVNAQQIAVVANDTEGWYKIGEKNVDLQRDLDEIFVLGADRFKSIKIKVLNATLDLRDMELYYESGNKQNVKINTTIKAPGESRVINLEDGENRSIKIIVFNYKTLLNSKDVSAHLEVWGLKINN